MSEKENLKIQLKPMMAWKKGNEVYANKLGISKELVKELLKEIKKEQKALSKYTTTGIQYIPNTTSTTFPIIKESSIKVNEEKGTVESTIQLEFNPRSVKQLAKLHKIDLKKYTITNYWSKLLPNGKFTSSVFSKKKQPEDYSQEDFSKFLKGYTPKPVKVISVSPINKTTLVDLEVSLADFHLAKQTLEKETIQQKKNQFLQVLTDLVQSASTLYKLNKIVFPLSNDFFHTDNYQNQTTNGTPQDVLVPYDQEYEEGFDLLVSSINFLKESAKEVEVVLVQGNHDRTKSFYLAHALEVYFKTDKNVKFQREHSVIKCVTVGNTFIGYHHGNCKIDDLPLLFATGKDSVAFGNAKYREVHTGDKHHYMAKEIKGVRIQQMPSLSGTDRWHLDNNFVNNIRSGIATIYDPLFGRIAEFESRI